MPNFSDLAVNKEGSRVLESSFLCATPSLSSLPEDLQAKIFSLLGVKDLVKVSKVSREFQRITAEELQLEMANFISNLMTQFDIQGAFEETQKLSLILHKVNSLRCSDPEFFKKCILEAKSDCVSIVKLRYVFLIDQLKAVVQPPRFSEDVFQLAALERRLDIIQSLKGSSQRLFLSEEQSLEQEATLDSQIEEISKAFREFKYLKRAVEVTKLLSDPMVIDRNLVEILDTFFLERTRFIHPVDYDPAFEIAGLIHDSSLRLSKVRDICDHMTKNGLDLQRSEKVAEGRLLIDKAKEKLDQSERVFREIRSEKPRPYSSFDKDGYVSLASQTLLAFAIGYAVTTLWLTGFGKFTKYPR